MQAHVLPMHQLIATDATNIYEGFFFSFQVKGKNYFRGEQTIHLDRIP